MFFNNKFNTFFGLNLTLVYTLPMCMAWRFHFPIRNYDFNTTSASAALVPHELSTELAVPRTLERLGLECVALTL